MPTPLEEAARKLFHLKIPEALFHTFYSYLLSEDNPIELRKTNSFKCGYDFINNYADQLKRFEEWELIKINNDVITLTTEGIDKLIQVREIRGLDIDIKIIEYLPKEAAKQVSE